MLPAGAAVLTDAAAVLDAVVAVEFDGLDSPPALAGAGTFEAFEFEEFEEFDDARLAGATRPTSEQPAADPSKLIIAVKAAVWAPEKLRLVRLEILFMRLIKQSPYHCQNSS